jgi:hypothetical protein
MRDLDVVGALWEMMGGESVKGVTRLRGGGKECGWVIRLGNIKR